MLVVAVSLRSHLIQLRTEPVHSHAVLRTLRPVSHCPALHKTERIPDLVAEIAALFHLRLVKEDIIACGGAEQDAEADAVRSIFVDQAKRIGRVAQLFAHLAAQFVSYDAGEIDVVVRNVVHVFLAGHDHAGHPEEDDIGSGDQVGSRIVVVDLGVTGVPDAIEERNGP